MRFIGSGRIEHLERDRRLYRGREGPGDAGLQHEGCPVQSVSSSVSRWRSHAIVSESNGWTTPDASMYCSSLSAVCMWTAFTRVFADPYV